MSSATVYLVGPPVQDAADIGDLLQAEVHRQLGREFKDWYHVRCVVLVHLKDHGSCNVESVMRKDTQGYSV